MLAGLAWYLAPGYEAIAGHEDLLYQLSCSQLDELTQSTWKAGLRHYKSPCCSGHIH